MTPHRYKWFSDERQPTEGGASVGDLSWAAAQARCGMDGGALARIDSAIENELITSLPWATRGWIGLSDDGAEGQWYWADAEGTPRTDSALRSDALYNNIADGEPSGDGDCGEMYSSGLWNDRSCSTALPFVCEVEDPVMFGRTGPHHLEEGEARYFELLHVHNDSVAGALLGLSLRIQPDDGTASFRTRVDGDHALSMEVFFINFSDAFNRLEY